MSRFRHPLRRLVLFLALVGLQAFALSARADDVINTATVTFVGTAGPITLPTNVVRAAIIAPPRAGTLSVEKSASRETAEIGDFVEFLIVIKNDSPNPVPGRGGGRSPALRLPF